MPKRREYSAGFEASMRRDYVHAHRVTIATSVRFIINHHPRLMNGNYTFLSNEKRAERAEKHITMLYADGSL